MEENLYMEDSIRTFSGHYVNVFDPNPDTIVIEDIAHALSQLPRFAGHLNKFYSVAQHSLFCCIESEKEFKLEALLHDASEAYLLDMPRPIKKRMPEYQKIEKNLQRVICEKFGLPFPMSKEVKDIDVLALQTEWDHLMLGKGCFGNYSQHEVTRDFLTMFKHLTNQPKNKD